MDMLGGGGVGGIAATLMTGAASAPEVRAVEVEQLRPRRGGRRGEPTTVVLERPHDGAEGENDEEGEDDGEWEEEEDGDGE